MIFLYSFLLLFLGAAKMLIDRRVARLERKYAQAAKRADQLLRNPFLKEGNSNRPDPCAAAKRQYLLGLLVQQRDRLENKHDEWQALSDRFARFVARLGDWKGRKLPYTLGALDVSFLFYLIDYLGAAQYVSLRSLANLVVTVLSR